MNPGSPHIEFHSISSGAYLNFVGVYFADSVFHLLRNLNELFLNFNWMQALKEILEENTTEYSPCMNGTTFSFERSNVHHELHTALQEVARLMFEQQQADPANGNGGDICSTQELNSSRTA